MANLTFDPVTHYMITQGSGIQYGQSSWSVYKAYPSFTQKGFRNSVNTPGFHDPNRRGRLKPNSFEFGKTKEWMLRGNWREFTPNSKPTAYEYINYSWSGPDFGASAPLGSYSADRINPSDLDAVVRNKLLSKIKDNSANLAELYAERHKTARMVGDTAMNFVNAMSALRKGNFVKAAEHLGVPAAKRARSRFSKAYAKDSASAVASGWLALQYGWKPLMSDLYGSLEVLASKYEGPTYVTATVKRSRVTPIRSQTITRDNKCVITQTTSGQKRTTVKYSVTYFRSPNAATDLARLGITNPVLLGWELVPYSFVVDWFLPIGEFLGNFDATLGLEFFSGYQTLFSYSLTNWDETRLGLGSAGSFYDTHLYASREDVYCRRSPLSGFPSPAIPRFKNPLGLVHMANALALLTNLFRK